MKKAVWIDDNVTITATVSEELTKLGIEAAVYESDPGVDVGPVDLLIIDLLLEARDDRSSPDHGSFVSAESGVAVLRSMLSRSPELARRIAEDETRLLFFSFHLVDRAVRRTLEEFSMQSDLRAFIVAKRPPRDASDKTSSVREAMAQVIAEVLRRADQPPHLSEQIRDLYVPETTLLDGVLMPISQYRLLAPTQKAELQDRVYPRLAPAARSIFRANPEADWVVFSGSDHEAFEIGEGEPPRLRDLQMIGDESGFPAFVVGRPLIAGKGSHRRSHRTARSVMEEIGKPPRKRFGGLSRGNRRNSASEPAGGTGGQADGAPSGQAGRNPALGPDTPAARDQMLRCPGGALSEYPTVTVDVGNRLRTYHFDTGAYANFLRASHLREHEYELEVDGRTWYETDRGGYYLYDLDDAVSAILWNQADSSAIEIKLDGYAIEGFSNWEHVRHCECNECPLGSPDPDADLTMCHVRAGVIGRGFLSENLLEIVISAGSELTDIRRVREEA